METLRLIVTQTLVPKIGGGRVALREYMEFDEEVRERMLNMSFDKWPFELMTMVPVRGKSMEMAARTAFDAGLIERRFYLMYAAGTKAAADARAEAEAEKAAENAAKAGGADHV